MSAADYYLCDRCYAKVFYDAEIDWDITTNLGVIQCICSECAKTHTVIVVEKDEPMEAQP